MEIVDLKRKIKDPVNSYDFEIIRIEAQTRINSGTIEENLEMQDYLGEIIGAYGNQLSARNPRLYESYETLWAFCGFASFLGHPDDVQDDLMQKSIFFAITKGFDPDQLLKQYFDFFENEEFIREVFRNVITSLEKNIETLGLNSLDIEGKKFLPQTKYWIMDYSKYPSKSSERSAVERLNYINQSPNCRQLTQSQRQHLLRLLEFYDDLIKAEPPVPEMERPVRAPVRAEEELPVPKPPMPLKTEQPATSIGKPMQSSSAQRPANVSNVVSPARPVQQYRQPGPPQNQKQEFTMPKVDIKQKEIQQGPAHELELPARTGVMEQKKYPVASAHAPSFPAQPKMMETKIDDLELHSRFQKPVSQKPAPVQQQQQPPQPQQSQMPAPASGSQKRERGQININSPEDLSRLTPGILHGADPRNVLKPIFEIISKMAGSGNYLAIMYNLEQSPLYKCYVNVGIALLNDPNKSRDDIFNRYVDDARAAGKDYLVKEEFEAFTDFRKDLDKLIA